MDKHNETELTSLRHTLKILEEENTLLAERAEDAMLLGAVSEVMEEETDPIAVIGGVIERISILKNVRCITCGLVDGENIREIATYAGFADEPGAGYPMSLSANSRDMLAEGVSFHTAPSFVHTDFARFNFRPHSVLVVPLHCRTFPQGVLISFCSEHHQSNLPSLLILLEQVAGMVVNRIDNLTLTGELAKLNVELESRIEKRTEELRIANAALQKSHDRFLKVLNGIDAHVYVLDMETREILFANRKMNEDYGSDLRGRICHTVFQEENGKCKECVCESLLESGENGQGIPSEFYNAQTCKHYMVHDRLLRWTDERLVKLQVASDITRLKEAEEEKRRYEEQLLHAQKMEAIGVLAGGVAHDFNNLLMGILGLTTLVREDERIPEEHQQHLAGVEKSVESAANLTRQLLGFAKGGKYRPRISDINHVIDESLELFRRTNKNVRIEQDLAADLWPAEVDRSQLQQVFLNLFINAGQAMPDGGILYIKSGNRILGENEVGGLEKGGSYLCIDISDTGEGIPREILPRIFEPFFTTKKRNRGTGLGLASSYGIIKNHNGAIQVVSQVGKGTTFTLYLPAVHDGEIESGTGEASVVTGAGSVLVIEDEKVVAEVTRHMLQKLGYQVEVAHTGLDGLACYRKKKSDIVMLDMILPDIGGEVVFERLRQMDVNVRVLLASGYSSEGKAQDLLDKGCFGFIQKPFTLAELSEKILAAREDG